MSESPRPPTFFRITAGLFVLLLLFGVALAVLLVVNAERINRDGGYGWLGAALLFLVVLILVSVAAAVTSASEYVVDVADIGTRCEVLVSFRGFARGTPVELVKQQLMQFNAASVLNEQARLVMFYPFARGKTGDRGDCEAWAVKSKEIVESLLDAFRIVSPLAA